MITKLCSRTKQKMIEFFVNGVREQWWDQ